MLFRKNFDTLGNYGHLPPQAWYSKARKQREAIKRHKEAVFIAGECWMGEGFCCPARQKIAGILDVLQDFLTQLGGKSAAQAALNGCEYSFKEKPGQTRKNVYTEE